MKLELLPSKAKLPSFPLSLAPETGKKDTRISPNPRALTKRERQRAFKNQSESALKPQSSVPGNAQWVTVSLCSPEGAKNRERRARERKSTDKKVGRSLRERSPPMIFRPEKMLFVMPVGFFPPNL